MNHGSLKDGMRARLVLVALAPVGGFSLGLLTSQLNPVGPAGTAVTAAAGLAGGLAVAWVAMRGVHRPTRALADAMLRMAAGDRTVPLPGMAHNDAIGAIARACGACRDSVAEAARLREQNEQLKGQAEDERRQVLMGNLHGIVSAGIQSSEAVIRLGHMRMAVDDTNAQMQTMASAVEELLTSVKEISANSEAAAGESRTVETAASAGVKASKAAVQSMQEIFVAVNGAAENVDELARSSAQIGEIVDQINNIAAQTNLLALNATIEAARAGEAGKGFAVVASEVKTLANQAGRAADDIAGRIADLRGRMDGIVAAMQGGAQAVSQGRESITAVGDQLEDVAERISTATAKMAEVAGILSQQEAAAGSIAEGSNTVARASEDNAAAIKQVLAEMDGMAKTLDEQIGSFAGLGGGAIVEIAKNDHVAFKRRIVDAVLERTQLRPDQLADHHNCRLGKWYDDVQDPRLRDNPSFRALIAPHERVHVIGRQILEVLSAGDRRRAIDLLDDLGGASAEVLGLLDDLATAMAEAQAEPGQAA